MTYVDLRPDNVRVVQVQLDDGIWVEAELEAYRKLEGVWAGSVRYTLGISQTYVGWFEARIRRADSA